MSITLIPRADGYQAGNMSDGGIFYMIASLRTKEPLPPGEKIKVHRFNPETGEKYETEIFSDQITRYRDLPRGDCTVHSSIGEISVKNIEEIISKIPNV